MEEELWVPTTPWEVLRPLIKLYLIFLGKFRSDETQLLGDIEGAIPPMKDFLESFKSSQENSTDYSDLKCDVEKLARYG